MPPPQIGSVTVEIKGVHGVTDGHDKDDVELVGGRV